MLGKWIASLSKLHRINFELNPWKTTWLVTFQLIPLLQAGHAKVSAPKLHACLVGHGGGWTAGEISTQHHLYQEWFVFWDTFLPCLRNFFLNCYSLEILVLPVFSKQGLSGLFLCFWSHVTAEGTWTTEARTYGVTWPSDGVAKFWVHIRKP